MQKSLSAALFSVLLGTIPITSSTAVFADEDSSSVIDLPDMQLQKKLREIEAKTEKQKAQLERRLQKAEQKAAECPPIPAPKPVPKCEVSDKVAAASVNSGTAAELENLRKQLSVKDAELKKKEREVNFLKNALAQASAKAQNGGTENQAAVPSPEPATQVAATPPPPPPEETPAAEAPAADPVFQNRVYVQLGYGPNGTQQKTREDGALTVDQKFTPIVGATIERMITPSWSVSGTVMSNKSAMGGVGYGF